MSFVNRYVLTAVALLVSAAPAAAQGLEFGIKGGMNISSTSNVSEITSTSDGDAGRSFGPILGGFVNVKLGIANLSVQPEVLVNWKGASLEDGDQSLRLTYLDIPLLVKLTAPAGGDDRALYVIAGPTIGFNLRAAVRDDDGNDDLIDSDIKSNEMGITFGGGLQARRWLIEGRFTEGLTNIAKDSSDTVKTRTIAVLFGLRF